MTAPTKAPVALLGGTFDPVHYGHLRFADHVRRALAIPEVRLVPAADPPHRPGPAASASDRLAMLRLAVAEFPGLVVDTRELARGGKSYTVLTLQELRGEDAGRPLLLLLGADAFLGLPTWHRWREVFDLAHLVVVPRPGSVLAEALPDELAAPWKRRLTRDPAALFAAPAGAIYQQSLPPQAIAATTLRAWLAEQPRPATLSGLLPPSVLSYIDRNHLYARVPDAP